jgi:hypothetical protein
MHEACLLGKGFVTGCDNNFDKAARRRLLASVPGAKALRHTIVKARKEESSEVLGAEGQDKTPRACRSEAWEAYGA